MVGFYLPTRTVRFLERQTHCGEIGSFLKKYYLVEFEASEGISRDHCIFMSFHVYWGKEHQYNNWFMKKCRYLNFKFEEKIGKGQCNELGGGGTRSYISRLRILDWNRLMWTYNTQNNYEKKPHASISFT
jgi:hypothetical protein